MILAYVRAALQLRAMTAEGCMAHRWSCNNGYLFGDRNRQVTSVDRRTDKDNSCYHMDYPSNQVSASDASRNKLLAVLTGLGKRFPPDWGHHFREETTIPKDWGPSLGNRRASEAMTSDQRSINPRLQEEKSLLQATHSERGKGQGRAKRRD